MKLNRNHEGYYDPTAGEAIRRVDKQRSKKKNSGRLTYRIGETKEFKSIFHN